MITIQAIGHIGRDAEVKQVGDTNLIEFSLASTKKGYTTSNGKQIDDVTTWINVKKWKGEGLAPYLKKGSKIAVFGELEIREHDGKYYTSIIAQHIEFASKKEETSDIGF